MTVQSMTHQPLGRPSGHHRVRRGLVVVLLAAIATVAIAPSTVGAQTYPPEPQTVTSNNANPTPGATVVLTATDFFPGATVTFYLGGTYEPDYPQALSVAASPAAIVGGQVIGSIIVDDNGYGTFPWVVPSGLPAGPLTIWAVGVIGRRVPIVATTTITIQASPTPSTTPPSTTPASTTPSDPAPTTAPARGSALPTTGSDSSALVRVGLVVLGLGALAAVVARRRMAVGR